MHLFLEIMNLINEDVINKSTISVFTCYEVFRKYVFIQSPIISMDN